jgi:hypothetical protein
MVGSFASVAVEAVEIGDEVLGLGGVNSTGGMRSKPCADTSAKRRSREIGLYATS